MTFTKTPPTHPGFYAWRRNSESPITTAVVVENNESWRAGTIPVEHCHLNGGEWCRLAPAEEAEKSVFEVIDSTDRECYDTLGLFPTLDEAKAAALATNWRGESNDGYFIITIHERPVGTLHGHNLGKLVAKFEWRELWDEDADESAWERVMEGKE